MLRASESELLKVSIHTMEGDGQRASRARQALPRRRDIRRRLAGLDIEDWLRGYATPENN